MCKTSVKKMDDWVFLHNAFTLDEKDNYKVVVKSKFLHLFKTNLTNLFLKSFSFNKSIFSTNTLFPHKLLLLLLSINLNIIKTSLKIDWSYL